MKELPEVFKNKIAKNVGNNKDYSYGGEVEETRSYDCLTVKEKIKNIINSPKYVYKADVIVVIDGIKNEKNIIGYNKDYLITMENEKIPISDITDIYFK